MANIVILLGDTYIQRKYFVPALIQTINEHFWLYFEQADPQWLVNVKKLYTPTRNAINAIEGMLTNSKDIFQPLLRVLVQIYVVFKLCGFSGIYILLTICLITLVGIYIIQYDYNGSKQYDKKMTKHTDFNRNYSDNLHIEVVNGRGRKTAYRIIHSEMNLSNLVQTHALKVSYRFRSLEAIHYIGITGSLIQISNYVSEKEYIAAFVAIRTACEFTWWLFHVVSNLFKTASTWGTMEKILHEYKPLHIQTNDLVLDQVIPGLKPGQEIRIKGPSGEGKTTWLQNKVIYLYQNFRKGQWLYLDQNMKVDLSDRTIYDVMESSVSTDILFNLAEMLGINNIINETTLYHPFVKPSCGEEKRILFLRGILPIFQDVSDIKVLFCDEITAGLDDENWQRVRKVIDMIKRKNISIISIDHHDFDADIAYCVKKKTIHTIPTIPITCNKSLSFLEKCTNVVYRCWKKRVDAYNSLEDDDTNKIQVLVWIPDIEVEPFIV